MWVSKTRAVSSHLPPPGKGTALSSASAPRIRGGPRRGPPETLTHQETVPGPGRVTATVSAAREMGLGRAGQPLSGRTRPRLGAGPAGSPPARTSTSQASRQKPRDLRLHVGEFLPLSSWAARLWWGGGGHRALFPEAAAPQLHSPASSVIAHNLADVWGGPSWGGILKPAEAAERGGIPFPRPDPTPPTAPSPAASETPQPAPQPSSLSLSLPQRHLRHHYTNKPWPPPGQLHQCCHVGSPEASCHCHHDATPSLSASLYFPVPLLSPYCHDPTPPVTTSSMDTTTQGLKLLEGHRLGLFPWFLILESRYNSRRWEKVKNLEWELTPKGRVGSRPL